LEAAWNASSARRVAPSAAEVGVLRALYAGRFAAEAGSLRTEVERILSHTFDFFGSGPVALGPEIDWHRDFKTGFRFPADAPSHAIDVVRLDAPCDVKVPWELARGQHLVRLAQAWLLEGDPRLPREFEAQVRSFLLANPPGLGVNWACTMDVALRALSWIWALALFEGAPFSSGFREEILLGLWRHGRWIPENLEMGVVNVNHFLSDVLGMVALGSAFDATPEGRRWLDDGARLLAREVLEQSTPDGAGIEGSVPYHRLVLELFLTGRRFLAAAGTLPDGAFDDRLAAMLRFAAACVTPEGLMPLVGDGDDGHALLLGATDVRDFRGLLSTGAVLFGDGRLKAGAGRLREETVWLLGSAAAAAFDDLAPVPSEETAVFPDGGYFVFRAPDHWAFVDAGPVGTRGRGGHGHNDVLSFEWHAHGRPVLTDSGTYVYTPSPEWRNRFRSTAFHNGIRVDGEEINRFPSRQALWTLRNDAAPLRVAFAHGADADALEASHTGYRRLRDPVTVSRKFRFDRRRARLSLADRLDGRAPHRVEFFFHAAPGFAGRLEGDALTLQAPDGFRARVVPASGSALSWERRDGWFSPFYGVKIVRETWVASASVSLPFEVDWEMTAEPAVHGR
ncbi:MAG: alginate lyase family protein, partial [Thermoanaerobaculia bacterium]